MRVWLIDDRAENRAAWLASFPSAVHETCSLKVFAAVPDLFAELEAGGRPDIVFVDFFLGGHLGLDVIERFVGDDSPVPLLVAYSSMSEANEGMVRSGAHLAMEKVKGVVRSRSIEEAIRGPEDLRQMIRQHLGEASGS